jgi:hypothetical protein
VKFLVDNAGVRPTKTARSFPQIPILARCLRSGRSANRHWSYIAAQPDDARRSNWIYSLQTCPR